MSYYIPGTKSISNSESGNVGINTINPQYALEVSGNLGVSSTGSIYFSNNLILSNSNNSLNINQPLKTNYTNSTLTSSFSPATGGSIGISSSQYISAPYNANYGFPSSTDFTIEFWLYMSSHGYDGGILSFYDSTKNKGWELSFDKTTDTLLFNYGVGVLNTGISLSTNTWSHISIVRSSGNITSYLNNEPYGSVSSNVAFIPDPTTLKIFGNSTLTSFTTGRITNLRIVNGSAVLSSYTQPLQNITNTVVLLNASTPATYLTDSSSLGATFTPSSIVSVEWLTSSPLSQGVTIDTNSEGVPYPLIINVDTSSYQYDYSTLTSIVFSNFSYANMNWSCHILIEAPNGETCWLINNPDSYETVNGSKLTFVDSITAPLISGPVSTGTYRPTSTNNAFVMPSPSPSSTNTSFIPLTASTINGQWNVWAYDDDIDSVYNGGSVGNVTLNFTLYQANELPTTIITNAVVDTITATTGSFTNIVINNSLVSDEVQSTTSTFSTSNVTNANITTISAQDTTSKTLNVTQSITESSNGYVIVGQGGASIGRSSNGNFWDSYSIFSTAGYGVAWNGSNTNPLYVAVGDGVATTMAYSSNGTDWTSLGTTTFIVGRGIAYNGSMWVAVGQGVTENINYSYDGLTWYPMQYDYTTPLFTTGIGLCVAYIKNKWWVGSNDSTNTLLSSTDGIYWVGEGNVTFPNSCNCFAYNGYDLAIGGGNDGVYSKLATFTPSTNSWVDITSSISTIIDQSVNGACWNTKQFFIVGVSSLPTKGASSVDCTQWTGNTLGGLVDTNATCIRYKNSSTSYLVGGEGTSTIIYSNNNGSTWSAAATPAFSTITNGILSINENDFTSGYSTFTHVISTDVNVGGTLFSNSASFTNATVSSQFLGNFNDTVNLPSYSFNGNTGCGMYHPSINNIGFVTNGLERMRVNENGYVGIGTGSPSYPLEVSGYVAVGDRFYMTQDSGGVNGNSWFGIKGGIEPDNLAFGFLNTGAAKVVDSLNFMTYGNNRMKIDSTGNVLIGYTSSNGDYKLQVNSQIFATNPVIATSDAKYKQNITSVTGSLDLVEALRPVIYEWKKHPIHNFNEGITIGFIAQEAKEVLKDTVFVNNIIKSNQCTYTCENGNQITEDFLGIAEGHLIPLLTGAIQEQSSKIKKQQTTISSLQIQIKSLQDQIDLILGSIRGASSFEELKSTF